MDEHEKIFTAWIHEHGAILYHVINGFAAGDDREDLSQEILLAIWKSIPVYRGQAKPSTYLYRVCHNAALLWTRTEKNYRRRVAQVSTWASSESAHERNTDTEERLASLYAAIHQLKPPERSLMLMLLDGLSYRDMAEVLGLSESNIGVRLNRIKKQLTQILKGNVYDY